MAETTQYAALMLDANGNVDRVRTTDGKIYYIASTIAMDSAEAAQEAAANCKTAMNRANNEVARVNSENARKSAESTRESNEAARKTAELKRHDEHIADQQALSNAAAAASGAASRADAAANQALQIANSIAQGSVGDSNIADLRSQNEKLASMLANATGKFFFMGGTVYAPSAKASISNGTVTLGSTCSVSGTTIVLA